MTAFNIPGETVCSELIIKNSRFVCHLGHAQTADDVTLKIETIRRSHPEASHTCWAYIAGPPGSDKRGMSDDGEPRGTAGKPMLSILDYSGFGEIWTTVTRYFGGTKLGTGGLVRAYSRSVQQALQLCRPVIREVMAAFVLTVHYSLLEIVEKVLTEEHAIIIHRDFQETISMTIQIPAHREKTVKRRLADISHGTISLKRESTQKTA